MQDINTLSEFWFDSLLWQGWFWALLFLGFSIGVGLVLLIGRRLTKRTKYIKKISPKSQLKALLNDNFSNETQQEIYTIISQSLKETIEQKQSTETLLFSESHLLCLMQKRYPHILASYTLDSLLDRIIQVKFAKRLYPLDQVKSDVNVCLEIIQRITEKPA